MYYMDNLISCGRISVSSDAYPQSMNADQIIFNKQYINLIKGHA